MPMSTSLTNGSRSQNGRACYSGSWARRPVAPALMSRRCRQEAVALLRGGVVRSQPRAARQPRRYFVLKPGNAAWRDADWAWKPALANPAPNARARERRTSGFAINFRARDKPAILQALIIRLGRRRSLCGYHATSVFGRRRGAIPSRRRDHQPYKKVLLLSVGRRPGRPIARS